MFTTSLQVWYHKCSNRGKGCANTRLADAGGCCIWYDEPALIKAVYKRLQVDAIPAMEVARDAKGPTGVVQPYLFKLPPGACTRRPRVRLVALCKRSAGHLA